MLHEPKRSPMDTSQHTVVSQLLRNLDEIGAANKPGDKFLPEVLEQLKHFWRSSLIEGVRD